MNYENNKFNSAVAYVKLNCAVVMPCGGTATFKRNLFLSFFSEKFVVRFSSVIRFLQKRNLDLENE